MRRNGSPRSGRAFNGRSWLLPLFASLLVSITLFLATLCGPFSTQYVDDSLSLDIISFTGIDDFSFVEPDPKNNSDSSFVLEPEAPRIAYLITGTKGDSKRIGRTLQAIYHPRNQYILHLDMKAPPRERIELDVFIKGNPVFSEVENVHIVEKPNFVTYKGPTMIACTLHAISILLKKGLKWDWFINLSALDYPLMTQDDILHVFSSLPRELNFVEHVQSTGWKLKGRGKATATDPSLYLSKKSDILWANEHRGLPESFKLFTGSAWMMLTRSFLEYCIWGWENLPRTLLMYYTNSVSASEGYFHTVICNSDEFQNTTISHDLHYISWDDPLKQHPLSLSIDDFGAMVESGAPFARKFTVGCKYNLILDKIDLELLGRPKGQFTPGAWCTGRSDRGEDPCSLRGDDSVFVPGPGSERLRELMKKLSSHDFRNRSCYFQKFDEVLWLRI